MKINVDYPLLGRNRQDVLTSVQIANAVQNYFHVVFRNEDHCGDGPDVDAEFVCNSLCEDEKIICITDKKLADNWFSHEYRNHAVISIFDWNGTYAPPSLKSYIIYQIAQALIHFAAELTEEITLNIVHEPPQGCMYDMCTNKPDIKLGMVAGRLCPKFKATLFQFGTSTVAIEAVERLLEYVRSEAIGKPKLIDPKKAFIVMRFSANDENDHAYQYGIKPALEELHIDCTRADTEVRSAQLLEKIKSNIDKSRLVIAKVDIENLNVFFELSLAMGQNKDVILVSESTLVLSLPSDLRNWECITYDKGNFLMLKTKILDYLRQNYVYK